MRTQAAVLGVDGGNSKSELVLVGADGSLLAHRRGATVSHQSIAPGRGLSAVQRAELGMERLAALARDAASEAGPDGSEEVARTAVLCLAGADFASDVRMLSVALGRQRLVGEARILNDAFAPLRAGTERQYGISVICGAGVNAAAISPDGHSARFAAVGDISGDWGGSRSLGNEALAAAVRARDGRGPRTLLETMAPAHFGLRRPASLTRQLYDGRIAAERLGELAPVVFEAAMAGDAVARGLVDRLADELATMALALARRLGMVRTEVDIVLAGGVFRTRDAAFIGRIEERVGAVMPSATLRPLEAPPVLGAALLALDRLPDAQPDAELRLRAALRGL
jgi:N-acetylglucosamine kinase-like BadF-type ATPase